VVNAYLLSPHVFAGALTNSDGTFHDQTFRFSLCFCSLLDPRRQLPRQRGRAQNPAISGFAESRELSVHRMEAGPEFPQYYGLSIFEPEVR
jgi:hypothetical protein